LIATALPLQETLTFTKLQPLGRRTFATAFCIC
jgi:hypothetical protein